MDTIYTDKHMLRDARYELYGGELVRPHERPSRAEYVLNRVRDEDLGKVIEPKDFGLLPLKAVHDSGYLEFLQSVWTAWVEAGFKGEAMPTTWPARRMSDKIPEFVEGKLGYYSMAAETAISNGTWEAAYASAQVALTGADLINAGQRSAFSLCRPPGHHAAIDMFGGYCFLNNSAIAAQFLRENGARRVAVVDVDFHHGNGTQDIFYRRDDILFVSLHGDPSDAFPHFLGYADELGEGDGCGFNYNYPMKPGTNFVEWQSALLDGFKKVNEFAPDAVVISLGLDTFESDPISFFKLKSEDFTTMGEDIASLDMPTLFVLEGGYDIAELGTNAVNVLQGFESKC